MTETPQPALGLYLSVPFCRAKCSFCNFSSDVFAPARLDGYVDRLCREIAEAPAHARRLALDLPQAADTIYFGGGTPSLLEVRHIEQIFQSLRSTFQIDPAAEITVECAPGQIADTSLAAFQRAGMNRVSLGVQSFIDRESAAVGRLHTAAECRAEIARLQQAGVSRLGLDLIAGLPHQTEAGWRASLEQAVATGVEHLSIYMLEVDDGSRLGRESLAGGRRYGASALPSEDLVADWYALACAWLNTAGLPQYEISNFGRRSRHNVKYWRRDPYLGFGLDAHSMLRTGTGGVRWANPEELDLYLAEGLGARGWQRTVEPVDKTAAFEETLFLGLRLVEGVDLARLQAEFPTQAAALDTAEMEQAGLLLRTPDWLCLTAAGCMASNEVFERLLIATPA